MSVLACINDPTSWECFPLLALMDDVEKSLRQIALCYWSSTGGQSIEREAFPVRETNQVVRMLDVISFIKRIVRRLCLSYNSIYEN